jgi:hypothetical protein
MRKTVTLGLGIWRFSCSAVIGTALGFSSLDISRYGPDGHADWHVSLASPAHAEQEYAILVMQMHHLVAPAVQIIWGCTLDIRPKQTQPGACMAADLQ